MGGTLPFTLGGTVYKALLRLVSPVTMAAFRCRYDYTLSQVELMLR